MRELNVLLDRDEHGEFLHFYTEVLGGRVFFEVVQRVGGYAGYGEVNAPVRMAAHRRLRAATPGQRRREQPQAAGSHRAGIARCRTLVARGERQPVRRVAGPDPDRLRGPA